MFNNLNYAFDVETGEIITNTQLKTKTSTKQTHPPKKVKKVKKAKKLCYLEKVKLEIRQLTYDKNFIRDTFKYGRLRLLRAILDNQNLELQKDLDGLFLANLLVYRKLLDDGVVNLELLKTERQFLLETKQQTLTPALQTIISDILGYIDFYFRDSL